MIIYLLPFFVCFVLAIQYEFKNFKSNSIFFCLILALGLFGALRFETGQDWEAYKNYFDSIFPISQSFIRDYFNTWNYSRFEIGYYYLNIFIKQLNLPYYSILFIAPMFYMFSFYYFIKNFKVNRFIILMFYISYPFLILEFAQVRQAFAIGFLLIGVKLFINNRKLVPILLFLLAISFQYSSIIYILIFLIVQLVPSNIKYEFLLFITVMVLLLILNQIGFFNAIKYVSPSNLQEKVDIYQNDQNQQGVGQILYSMFLFFLACYIYFFSKNFAKIEILICRYTVYLIIATVITSIVFAGNYVMYSRMYLMTSLFTGITLAIINKNLKLSLHKFLLFFTLMLAFINYFRLILFYQNEYIPYKTWLLK